MMNFVFLVIFGVFLNNGPSSAQVLQFGQCADVVTMKYFELERTIIRATVSLPSKHCECLEGSETVVSSTLTLALMMVCGTDRNWLAIPTIKYFLGQWYEIERFPSWYENYGNCAFKRVQACGRNVEIDHGFVRDGVQYILHVNSTYIPGDDAVFVIHENNIDPIGVPISVIATDYYNYAVAYGCKFNENLGIKYIAAWILSRNTTLEPEFRELARLELNTLPHGSIAHLEPVPQRDEDCEYLWTAHVRSNDD